MNLDNKIALITGASKGIGKAIAYAMGKAGATVIISSRNQAALDEVVAEFATEGITAFAIAANAGKEEDLKQLVALSIEKCARIDILVNNAASNPVFGPLEMTDEKAFDKIMDVNVKGSFLLTRAVLPHMKAIGSGHIVAIASDVSKRTYNAR